MKIVWKIFQLIEVSTQDEWIGQTRSCFVLTEAFTEEFESEEGAFLFLNQEIDDDAEVWGGDGSYSSYRGEFKIEKLIKAL